MEGKKKNGTQKIFINMKPGTLRNMLNLFPVEAGKKGHFAMNYHWAILAGRISLVLVFLASSYYLIYRVSIWTQGKNRDYPRLVSLVSSARISHPYLASLISVSVIYHVIVMWKTWVHEPLTMKFTAGVMISVVLSLMANLGWALKLRPQNTRVRQIHRIGMLPLLILILIHMLGSLPRP